MAGGAGRVDSAASSSLGLWEEGWGATVAVDVERAEGGEERVGVGHLLARAPGDGPAEVRELS